MICTVDQFSELRSDEAGRHNLITEIAAIARVDARRRSFENMWATRQSAPIDARYCFTVLCQRANLNNYFAQLNVDWAAVAESLRVGQLAVPRWTWV